MAELDEEHDECEGVLNALAANRDAPSIAAVIAAYESHFAHEEALLDEHLYAAVVQHGAGGGFNVDASTRNSHYEDHARMLRELRALHAAAAKGTPLPADAIDSVLRDFEKHATRYDGNYATKLSNSLAAVAAH